MITIIEKILIAVASFLSFYTADSILLYQAHFDKKQLKKAIIIEVIIVLIIGVTGTYDYGGMSIIVLAAVNLCFEGKLMERISVNTLAMAIYMLASLAESILFKQLQKTGDFLWLNNELISEVAILMMILILKKLINILGMFDKKREGVRWLTVNHSLSLCFLGIVCILLVCTGDIIETRGVEAITNQSRLSNTLMIIAVTFTLTIIMGVNDDMGKQYYKWINQLIENQVKRQLKYYQRLEAISKETRAIKHDMKNHMIVIKRLAENEDLDSLKQYITNIEETTEKLDNIFHTGNSIVDAIINEKIEAAHRRHIKLNVDMQLPGHLEIEPIDLCIFIANSIDNAFEACEKIEDIEERQVSITCSCKSGYFIYTINNTTKDPVKIVNRQIATSKQDCLNHGYGIINMKNSIEKYDGELTMNYKENRFYLYIEIPIKKSNNA